MKCVESGEPHLHAHEITIDGHQPGWRTDDLIFWVQPIYDYRIRNY